MLDPANWMTLTALSLAYLRLGATEMAALATPRSLRPATIAAARLPTKHSWGPANTRWFSAVAETAQGEGVRSAPPRKQADFSI
jgi:hypothetical protein